MKRKTHQRQAAFTYTLMHEMCASPTEPMPIEIRRHQTTRMYQGLHAIETAEKPTTDDWRVVSDAVNLMETLVEMGEAQDASGLLDDAVTAMAMAGKRGHKGQQIRLDGPGILAVRSVLEDYAACLEQLSHRTMVRCHRLTERRIREILAGKRQPHDIEVISI